MKHVDVVVVGGGIHGVGVAQAVAAAGHTVLLLEKTSLAAGTSSRSSKLIHGGLRYLESGQFHLVRESLRERRILLAIAPELVRLKPFILPLVSRDTATSLAASLGPVALRIARRARPRDTLRYRTQTGMDTTRWPADAWPADGAALLRCADRRCGADARRHAIRSNAWRASAGAGGVLRRRTA